MSSFGGYQFAVLIVIGMMLVILNIFGDVFCSYEIRNRNIYIRTMIFIELYTVNIDEISNLSIVGPLHAIPVPFLPPLLRFGTRSFGKWVFIKFVGDKSARIGISPKNPEQFLDLVDKIRENSRV